MPTTNIDIGPSGFPLTAGAANAAILSPVSAGLAHYLAHWVRTCISPALAMLGGPIRSTSGSLAVTDACPTGHVFPWNHRETWMHANPTTKRNMLPALYCWRQRDEWSAEHSRLAYDAHRLTMRADYIFPELQWPDGFNARSGVFDFVADTMKVALGQGRHPTFGWNGDPAGTSILVSLDLEHLAYLSATLVAKQLVPVQTQTGSQEGHRKSGFPCVEVEFEAVIKEGDFKPGPADVQTDATFRFFSDGLQVLVRYLPPAPDTL